MTNVTDLWRFDLTRGASNNPRQGACLMDAVSWLEYGKLGDHPRCVAPKLAAYGRFLNDMLSDHRRQQLKRFIPRLVGTWGGTQEDYLADQQRFRFLEFSLRDTLTTIVAQAFKLSNAPPFQVVMKQVLCVDYANQSPILLSSRPIVDMDLKLTMLSASTDEGVGRAIHYFWERLHTIGGPIVRSYGIMPEPNAAPLSPVSLEIFYSSYVEMYEDALIDIFDTMLAMGLHRQPASPSTALWVDNVEKFERARVPA